MAISAVMGAISTGVTAFTGGAFLGIASIGLTGAFGHFLITTAMGAALNALTPKPSVGGAARGYSISGESGAAVDHQIIYGRRRVGGVRLYDVSTGNKNQFLHRILAFAGHEVEEFEEIYLNEDRLTFGYEYIYDVEVRRIKAGQISTVNDTIRSFTNWNVGDNITPDQYEESGGDKGTALGFTVLTVEITSKTTDTELSIERPARYKNHVKIRVHLGSNDQEADGDLIEATQDLENGKWTTDHRLRGIAYLYIRFKYDADVFANGLPSVSATIKGKKVFDPRTGTTAWSNNPALCLRDYLTSSYGFDQPSRRIADDYVIVAANISDETVSGGKRYTCNGAFTTGFKPSQVLSDLLTSMGGLLWYSQGKWRMKAAKWQEPTITLNEDDLRSGISLSTRHSRRDNFNTVRGKFTGPQSDWQEADYPEVSEEEFVEVDGGIVNTLDYPLPFTTDPDMAQRIARIALRRNREQLTFSANFGLKAFQIQVGDFIRINNQRFGWTNKVFEVTNWTFGLEEGQDLQVQMTLREISEAVFNSRDPSIFESNNTNLPDFTEVEPPGITLSTELKTVNQQVIAVLVVDLSTQEDPFFESAQVEFRPSGENSWIALGQSGVGKFEAQGIQDGLYDVRARVTNTLGGKSAYTYVYNWYASGFAAPPSVVQNFNANIVGNLAYFSWNPVTDLDLSHYKIRYSPLTSGASYQNAIDLVERIARPGNSVVLPARAGTYFIKAVDKLGNPSPDSSEFVVNTNIADIESLNVVETVTESPTFSGSKTNVTTFVDGATTYLILNSTGLSSGSGTYEFANVVDLGDVYPSRVSSNAVVDFLDYANTFDAATGNFDSRSGDFDGDPSQFDTASVKVQVAFTNDNPSGSPVWSSWQDLVVSDLTARGFKFRALLTTTSTTSTPAIKELSATVDMPDRVEAEQGLSVTGTLSVTFPSAFKVTPSLGISITLPAGHRYQIASKSRTGFTINVYDALGVLSTTAVTFDYVAKGYGKGN